MADVYDEQQERWLTGIHWSSHW